MKIFISQPMNGRSNEDIKNERQLIHNWLNCYICDRCNTEQIEIIDSFFEDAPHDAKPLWYLGESLKLMSEADLVVFAPGYDKSRGCIIEYDCARQYDLIRLCLPNEYWKK